MLAYFGKCRFRQGGERASCDRADEHPPPKKGQREFYIPRLGRERSLYGTEFEIKLRNELTQRSIAKECAAWVRRKARFKSFRQSQGLQTMFGVRGDCGECVYFPFDELTTKGLGTAPQIRFDIRFIAGGRPMKQSVVEMLASDFVQTRIVSCFNLCAGQPFSFPSDEKGLENIAHDYLKFEVNEYLQANSPRYIIKDPRKDVP